MAQSINVLSLDFSTSTANAAIVAVTGNTLSLIESYSSSYKIDELEKLRLPIQNQNTTLSDAQVNHNLVSDLQLPDTLFQLISQIKSQWRFAVLTIPSQCGFSLNLALPFSDKNKISKILRMEVQDLVPFEIDDYHLATSLLEPANEDSIGVDVKVDLAEKNFIRGLLSSLQKIGIDPRIVTFPATTLSTLIDIAPTYFGPDCALVMCNQEAITVLGVVDGTPRSSRTIKTSDLNHNQAQLLKEVRLFIASTERRYNCGLQKVYILGSFFDPFVLKDNLGREFEHINSSDFLRNVKGDDLALANSILAYQATQPTNKIHANFRNGDFKFRPQFKELLLGIKSLSPYIIGFLSVTFIGLLVTYISNISQINSIEQAINDRIKKTIPNFKAPAGQEISAIAQLTQQTEEQLKDLGSLATLSPLEAFLAVSQDIPQNLNVNINELVIKETRISLKGTAPDYATLDKVEQILKAKRETYCAITIRDNSAGARSSSIGFEITLQLC